MAKYINADALKKTFNEFPCLWVQYTIAGHTDKDIENIVDDVLTQAKQTIISEINEQPTADVVEVTRCKDCMHTEIDKYAPAECQNRCKLSQLYHEPTFFCKCGEPRTDLLEWIHRGDDDE